jgi:hypothetical protein
MKVPLVLTSATVLFWNYPAEDPHLFYHQHAHKCGIKFAGLFRASATQLRGIIWVELYCTNPEPG